MMGVRRIPINGLLLVFLFPPPKKFEVVVVIHVDAVPGRFIYILATYYKLSDILLVRKFSLSRPSIDIKPSHHNPYLKHTTFAHPRQLLR